MVIQERDSREERILRVAEEMLTAARTAPKAKGLDHLECCVLTGEDIAALSREMLALFDETGRPVFKRDAGNILSAGAVLVVAAKTLPMGLNCRHCGFDSCADKPAQVPCVFNSVDIGIALGSACATAADHRVDTRVMYSAGMAAQRMKLLGDCKEYFCIPLSISSKSPFFDRG